MSYIGKLHVLLQTQPDLKREKTQQTDVRTCYTDTSSTSINTMLLHNHQLN